jgi:hypothetical protein
MGRVRIFSVVLLRQRGGAANDDLGFEVSCHTYRRTDHPEGVGTQCIPPVLTKPNGKKDDLATEFVA